MSSTAGRKTSGKPWANWCGRSGRRKPAGRWNSSPRASAGSKLADDSYSIGLALQQVAPCIRTGQLPRGFLTPLVRGAGRPKASTAANGSKPRSPTAKSNGDVSPAAHRIFCRVCRKWGGRGTLVKEKFVDGQVRLVHAAC